MTVFLQKKGIKKLKSFWNDRITLKENYIDEYSRILTKKIFFSSRSVLIVF